ncbi:MAG: hypothetical protein JSR91_01560 [Proteobacteria bacterium]|nr:hypothetical protein [Pseudomonadota bacterium]
MEKAVAAQMIEVALSLEKDIGELDRLVSQVNDGNEKKELIEALGKIIGIITKDFVFRIAREHPELDPDR